MEKVNGSYEEELDAIRAKDVFQGGLTQGQQTQIARNEQRTEQTDDMLPSLEELGVRQLYPKGPNIGTSTSRLV
ncbi:hypothetical protein RchiOBHm_Chr3g0478401 [Rosa chinensis]|uniref:Uncharacterized protein n=1 Tax=Rosa chinensis TaxID=74649 RepID=A0A2P6RD50_ROSCH|nr:hypothetical protein RchiOBHm_Chr3g0478401 [Rosa chinensis]